MTKAVFYALLFVIALPGLAQSTHKPEAKQAPMLLDAGLPKYPPIALAADITGSVTVEVDVMSGKVSNAEVLRENCRSLGKPIRHGLILVLGTLREVKSWRFSDDVNTKFDVTFTYSIQGLPTDDLTNPNVEILPSLDVNITQRPVKPTVNYSR